MLWQILGARESAGMVLIPKKSKNIQNLRRVKLTDKIWWFVAPNGGYFITMISMG